MYDYTFAAPWDTQKPKIITVIVNFGITNIGNNAFKCYTALTSITIPLSATLIGDYSFFCCTGLTSVAIPASITSIGNSAFFGCSGLIGTFKIYSSVNLIGNSAFSGCNNLEYVNYGGSSDPGAASSDVFYNCEKLKSVNVPEYYYDNKFCGIYVNKPTLVKPKSILSIVKFMPLIPLINA
jgi:hypothetical protein